MTSLLTFDFIGYLLGMRLVEKFWPGGEFWTGKRQSHCGAGLYKTLVAQLVAMSGIIAVVSSLSGIKMEQSQWNFYYLFAGILAYMWGYFHYCEIRGKRLDANSAKEERFHGEVAFAIKRDPEDSIGFLTVRSVPGLRLEKNNAALYAVTAGGYVQVGPHFINREHARQFARTIIDSGLDHQDLLVRAAFDPSYLQRFMP